MLHYILQTIAFQLVFLMIYDLVLRKETFFNLNRGYLLVTAVLSVVIPFIKIEQIKSVVSKDFVITLPEVIIGNTTTPIDLSHPEIAAQAGLPIEEPSTSIWSIILIIGMCLTMAVFLFKMSRIVWLTLTYKKRWFGNVLIIELLNSTKAFSFFHYIFMGEKLKPQERAVIVKHEIIHVKEKHTLDLLLFEILRIVFWFNPLVYMYQSRIALLHEYIADAKAIKQQNPKDYYQNLLSQIFETQEFSFVNPFFKQSFIKKRIHMLSKSKSKQIHLLKYLLFIPMVFTMLLYTTSYAQESNNQVDLSQYSYSMSLDDTQMSEATKKTHEAYEAFLKSNHDYVSWAKFDSASKRVFYSVHSKNEERPDGFTKHTMRFEDGSYYVTYMNLSSVIQETMEIRDLKASDSQSEEVPFAIVDKSPTFDFCDALKTNKERKKCMTENVAMHVNKTFNTNLASSLGLSGKQRINVIFKVDKEGFVTEVKSRAPHPALEKEAIRVINELPQFIPGEHKGQPVVVPYSLPIIFQVADKNSPSKNTNKLKKDEVLFSELDKAPSNENCENIVSNEDAKKCFRDFVSSYVNQNFNTKLAPKLGLEHQYRIVLAFKINKEGAVVQAKATATHPELETEAIRVINSLPKFTPGELNGEPVTVNYFLPILFQTAPDQKDKN
ncbi:energy transducer TonB [Psychroserpens sp. BH13MA-6]